MKGDGKRQMAFLLAGLLVALAGSAAAEAPGGMMGGGRAGMGGMPAGGPSGMHGMMGGMPGGEMRRPGAHRHHAGIGRILAMKDELQLSPEQVKALIDFQTETRKDRLRRRADLEVALIDLHALLRQDPVDLAKAEVKVREISAKQADLRIARVQTLEKAKAILKPDQRAKFVASLQAGTSGGEMGEAHERMHQMMGMMRMMMNMMQMMGGMGGR